MSGLPCSPGVRVASQTAARLPGVSRGIHAGQGLLGAVALLGKAVRLHRIRGAIPKRVFVCAGSHQSVVHFVDQM